jgi:hypothetical protein
MTKYIRALVFPVQIGMPSDEYHLNDSFLRNQPRSRY